MKLTAILIRWVVGTLFVAAGILKAIHPGNFEMAIANYRLLTPLGNFILAVILPYLEIVSGAALITGWKRRGGLLLSTLLAFVFLGAISSAIWRHLNISCGCFGSAATTPDLVWALVRDLLLIGGIAFLWRFDNFSNKSSPM